MKYEDRLRGLAQLKINLIWKDQGQTQVTSGIHKGLQNNQPLKSYTKYRLKFPNLIMKEALRCIVWFGTQHVPLLWYLWHLFVNL